MKLTWLHISDLHVQGSTKWDSERIRVSFVEDLAHMRDKHQLTPSYIFFTGDAAFGNNDDQTSDSMEKQLDEAEALFQAVRSVFNPPVPKSNFFLVPGNHDVDRRFVAADQYSWLDRDATVEDISRNISVPTIQFQRYMDRLKGYKSFLLRHGYDHLLVDEDRLIFSRLDQFQTYKIGIAGFNTAWSCGRKEEKARLWMGSKWQQEVLFGKVRAADFRIALLHHPSNWLVEAEDSDFRRALQRDFSLVLHGHEHEEWINSSAGHITVAAGALYDKSTRPTGYSFGTVDLSSGVSALYLRTYESKGGGWVPELIFGKTDNEGIWANNVYSVHPDFALPVQQGAINKRDAKAALFLFKSIRNKKKTRYGSAEPPRVEAWVGREDELARLTQLSSGVAVITGIGGQGKSALVAQFLAKWRQRNPQAFWDWRDCKEQGERFHTQLINLVEHFSDGELTGADLASEETADVIDFFFHLIDQELGVVVLDNVDHYVNVNDKHFRFGINDLVERALETNHHFLLILTCRPRISYLNPQYQEIHLKGLTLEDTRELFSLRGAKSSSEDSLQLIREFWRLTEGHPLWLTLLANQMSRTPAAASSMLEELQKGITEDLPKSMLRAIWKSLNEKQKTILRAMSEIQYPESSDIIHAFVRSTIPHYSKFNQPFRGLRALSLVVERESPGAVAKFDLHPLVRHFIRSEYSSKSERLSVIQEILKYLKSLTGKTEISYYDSPLLLERLSAQVELEFESNDVVGALSTLAAAKESLIAKSRQEEFFRLTKLLLAEANWSDAGLQEQDSFHNVVGDLITSLTEQNRLIEAGQYLRQYQSSVDKGTAAYINFTRISAFVHWLLKDYDSAVAMASEGVKLKKESQIDTGYDAEYILALALRDSGKFDDALEVFRKGVELPEVIAEDHKLSGRDAQYYGNIGRCLFLKGRTDVALICYSKSADLLFEDWSALALMNRGYACVWIADALVGEQNLRLALLFYRTAEFIWRNRAPLRAVELVAKLKALEAEQPDDVDRVPEEKLEILCHQWVRDFLKP